MSGSICVHHVDTLVTINITYITSREGYLLTIGRPRDLVFYAIPGAGEVGLASAVSDYHIDIELPTVIHRCEGYLLAIR